MTDLLYFITGLLVVILVPFLAVLLIAVVQETYRRGQCNKGNHRWIGEGLNATCFSCGKRKQDA